MIFDDSTSYAIVADIGGTFARFSRVNLENLVMDKIEIYSCAAYDSLESVLLAYKAKHELKEIKHAALAIACPVLDDVICMTNAHWRFSISELKHKLGLTELKVLNDFNAIAMSLPVLSDQQLLQIGRGTAEKNGARAVLGAGTGLGVAFLASNQDGYSAQAGEGGHTSWGAKTEQEWFIYCYLKEKYDHVSYERLLSGHGLENLYQALSAFHQQKKAYAPASEIITLALARQCTVAEAAVAQFFAILGSYAGDLALIFAALGGVYIAGGLVPRLISMLDRSDFRSCFEEKGRFKAFNAKIPTYVITAEQPGILGAAVYLKQSWSK
ncbi:MULTISPECIES: glucokinase [Legionella]|uniref:Glucokinase n=1 Tax=Legionella resiliens TaxID=2905958 RepID=A0ABS8X9H0_9GAMM|nr:MULTISPECIES: glucokinase [unclassified Legionella]MCE0724803.1 glucokinase [Legionella sp. 9fVS26]MCE3533957.1 glucokinase [Legionella sp. 8cVS16]QLZ70192.1 glucokinase [Legionella sp. PC1000]